MKSLGRPSPPTGDFGLCGIYYAVVTENKDEEMQLGRIQVRFPWMPGGDQDMAAWAQLAVPMEGDQFGTFTLPEKEDVVAVMFLAGDVRYPIIIGGVWKLGRTSRQRTTRTARTTSASSSRALATACCSTTRTRPR